MYTDGLETFFTANEQTALFFGSVAMGAGLGAVYDIFRIIRIIFPAAGRRAAVTFCDILYMLIFGAAVFFYSAVFGRGEVRLFYAVGAFLGALLFILTAGQVIVSAVRECSDAVRRFLGKIYDLTAAPLKAFLKRKYIKITEKIVHGDKNVLENAEISKNPLPSVKGMLYNIKVKMRHSMSAPANDGGSADK